MVAPNDTDAQNVTDANIGRVLKGQYRVDALLGHGGMGSVYRGHQLSIGRPVAIKVIAQEIADNPECIKRFRREAEAMATLHHPNTVRLFDFSAERGELFMVMELLEGQDLSHWLTTRGALPLTEALSILRQVLEALSEAHTRGIVHRDLKPANVFMSTISGGQVYAKVMDFGIAGIEADLNTKLTLAGTVLGTPAYMSPEQAQGQPVDGRADLYSLGVMLFEMLTGRTPFEADSIVSLLLAQVSQAPPSLAEVRSELAVYPEVQALLNSLLAKLPAQRPSDAREVIARVDALLARGPVKHVGAREAAGAQNSAPGVVAMPNAPRQAAAAGRYASQVSTTPKTAAAFPATLFASLARSSALWQRAPRAAAWTLSALAGLALLALLWKPSAKAPPAVPHIAPSELYGSAPENVPAPPEGVSTAPGVAVSTGDATRPTAAKPAHAREDEAREQHKVEARDSAREQHKDAAETDVAQHAAQRGAAPEAQGEAREEAKPFSRIRNTLDKFLSPGPGASKEERRYALLQRGPAQNNVVAAKRAYRAGQLSPQAYEDTIWVLKTRRARKIDTEKRNLKAGAISRDEYKRRIARIDHEYTGS